MTTRQLNMIEISLEIGSTRFFKVSDYKWKRESKLLDEEYEDMSHQTMTMMSILRLGILEIYTPLFQLDYKDDEFVAIFDLGDESWTETELAKFCQELEDWLDTVNTITYNKNQEIIFPKHLQKLLDIIQ
jgi:hypothetical protein